MIARRSFLKTLAGAAIAPSLLANQKPFQLRYVLSSALYGEMPLDVILPEVAKTGCSSIDIWCRVHGNQREQIAEMGDDAFAALLRKNQVKLGVSTRYPLGPFRLQEEMAWIKKLGGTTIVCGSNGPKNPEGAEAKAAVLKFLEDMKPHAAKAEELGVVIAVENHLNTLLAHPDSIRYFAEFNKLNGLGMSFAPHHLHAWVDQIPTLIRELGKRNLPFVYFQEHSEGASKKMPKEIELQQLPGFGGGLDYRPIVKALREIEFSGDVEIFMHPTPRGVPILPTVEEIREVLLKSRAYVEKCLTEGGV